MNINKLSILYIVSTYWHVSGFEPEIVPDYKRRFTQEELAALTYERLDRLPEESKLKRLTHEIQKNGMSQEYWHRDIDGYRHYICRLCCTSTPDYFTLYHCINKLGEIAFWSNEESMQEFNIHAALLNKASFTPLSVRTQGKFGWDNWEFDVLPTESKLKSLCNFKRTCDHRFASAMCNSCCIRYFLQRIATHLFYARQQPLATYQSDNNYVFFLKECGEAWPLENYVNELATLTGWSVQTAKSEAYYLLAAIKKLKSKSLS